ncbi:MAG: NUDIX domain-containing protein [Candidatus Pacebacteria bacterium]|nr:NUDIX domain-containing protein [Candidatus Paceibacterota bacterium]
MVQKSFIVVKALIQKDDKFLLLKKATTGDSLLAGWETPGGHLEEGEDLLIGLAREIKEETGLRVNILYPFHAYWVRVEDDNSLVGISYLAGWQSGIPAVSDEHNRYQWANISEIRTLQESKGLQKEIDAYELFIARS